MKFEARRVRDLLQALGLDDRRGRLIDWYDGHWGERRLTFEAFHEEFPTFPWVLEGQSFYATFPEGNPWSRLGRWYTDFTRTFVFKRYATLLGRYEHFSDPKKVVLQRPVPEHQRGLPLGMVFPWQGVKGGLILHNGEPLTEAQFTASVAKPGGRPFRVHVERYAPWVEAVAGSGWTPESPPRATTPVAAPPAGPPLLPGLLKVCGHDPRDAWLLTWLLRATGPWAGPDEWPLVARVDGVPHVAVSHPQLSEATGLTVQQVRDAVAGLCRRGFVSKHQGVKSGAGRRNYLRVHREAVRAAGGVPAGRKPKEDDDEEAEGE